jgi:hypothetical protein
MMGNMLKGDILNSWNAFSFCYVGHVNNLNLSIKDKIIIIIIIKII